MDKIKTIVRKEWAEVFKNRLVLSTVIFMPLLFALIPLVMLYLTRGSSMNDLTTDMPAQILRLCPQGVGLGECFQAFLASQMMLLFMLSPLIIPVNIAAYSIVGEKQRAAWSRYWQPPSPRLSCSSARTWQQSSRQWWQPGLASSSTSQVSPSWSARRMSSPRCWTPNGGWQSELSGRYWPSFR